MYGLIKFCLLNGFFFISYIRLFLFYLFIHSFSFNYLIIKHITGESLNIQNHHN